jgi:hypothetical protein
MKKAAIVLYVLAVGVLIYWFASGARIFTQSQKMVTETDPLLGTTSERWVDDYHPGLDLLGPIAGGLIVLGSAGLWMAKKRASSTPQPAR